MVWGLWLTPPKSAASGEDEQTQELEQLEEQRLRERASSQVGDEEEENEDEEEKEHFSEDDVFVVSKKARSKVNLSPEDEEPTRERLAELLGNPYPHKHRKKKTSS
jgi:hypothetical protein